MSNKRRKPQRANPRILDRIQVAMSTGRHLDGMWIGSWRGLPEHLRRVEAALLLIKQHRPLDYARIIRELQRIWVSVLFHGLGEYKHSLRACILDERFVGNPATGVEQIASTIVHEATHARLERYGIEYKEERRVRIEAICFRRELAFAVRLPDASELQQGIAHSLEWYQTNQDYFSNAHFKETHSAGGIEALRYLKTPEWCVRGMLMVLPVINWTRRLLRFGPR